MICSKCPRDYTNHDRTFKTYILYFYALLSLLQSKFFLIKISIGLLFCLKNGKTYRRTVFAPHAIAHSCRQMVNSTNSTHLKIVFRQIEDLTNQGPPSFFTFFAVVPFSTIFRDPDSDGVITEAGFTSVKSD